MSEAKIQIDTETLVPKPSQEVIGDPNIAWHAIRGYDFAGLEAMLEDGLLPSENQQDSAVCLSASPQLAWSNGREANSFYAYTLKDGISLAISQDYPQYPTGNHGGFVDEVRQNRVDASAIKGVMLPEKSLATPLTEVSTSHEARMPLKAQHFIERTLRHITDLGGQVDEETLDLASLALEKSLAGEYLDKDTYARIEKAFMKAYSDTLTQVYGLENPTVGDILKIIFDKAKVKPEVFVYTDEQKQEIGTANVKIAAKSYGRSLGSFVLSSRDRSLG